MYRNELIEMNRVRLVFLLVDLDAAEITPAVGLDTEINCPSAALALFLGFRLISSELDLEHRVAVLVLQAWGLGVSLSSKVIAMARSAAFQDNEAPWVVL